MQLFPLKSAQPGVLPTLSFHVAPEPAKVKPVQLQELAADGWFLGGEWFLYSWLDVLNSNLKNIYIYMGVWKTLLKWMIWGYHYFRKHPYI